MSTYYIRYWLASLVSKDAFESHWLDVAGEADDNNNSRVALHCVC